ncbi:unnamed protein product, partial [Arabidopsis halleri]
GTGLLLVFFLAIGWNGIDRGIHGTRNSFSTEIHPKHLRDLSNRIEVPPFPLKGITFQSPYLP